jgi:2-polyprenyl-3-methyl-5-hydroxy-6-metoxy-1,4-benzoquinol methylase
MPWTIVYNAHLMASEVSPPTPSCWCGNTALGDFSEAYAACSDCGTLVSRAGLRPEETEVHDDERDFYGKPYWLDRQRDELGFPDIYERARLDLPERCVHWLRTLLGYRLPPGRILELGSGHGGFVALMRAAGFDATGLELSPWVVDFSRTAFGIPVLLGPIEAQSMPERSLDVIALQDVLEHLAHPASTMRRCAELLDPDGFVQVQTPCYPDGQSHRQLVAANHPFLAMLQEREHLYLFSRRAVRRLLTEAGLPVVTYEPALFPYDMVVVASRHELKPTDPRQRDEILRASPAARLAGALVDLDARVRDATARLDEVERDRQNRIEMIDRLNDHIEGTRRAHERTIREQQAVIEGIVRDRQERIAMIERLNRHIEATGADYDARGRIIEDQQAALERLDRDRQTTIEALEADRQERIAMIERLNRHIEATSADYEKRGQLIRDQQATVDGLKTAMDGLRAELARVSSESAIREKLLTWLTAESEAQLRVIADQQATVEKMVRQREQHGADLEALVRQMNALTRSRVFRLLRKLRVL